MDTRGNGEDYKIWFQKEMPKTFDEWKAGFKKPVSKESKTLIRHFRQVHLKKKKKKKKKKKRED